MPALGEMIRTFIQHKYKEILLWQVEGAAVKSSKSEILDLLSTQESN
jgi:hypothetical protein